MVDRIKNWYFGEDGTKPIRRMKFHIILLILLFIAIIIAFRMDYDRTIDDLQARLLTTTGIFGFVVCFGFAVTTFHVHFTEIYSIAIYHLVLLAASFVCGFYIGWIILPLYAILAILDTRYYYKSKKSNPNLFTKSKPPHRDLTKKND